LSAQFFDQIGGLLEWHVAIVVAVDEQYRERQFAMLSGPEIIERRPLMMRPRVRASAGLARY
jgi:hypothetical protein